MLESRQYEVIVAKSGEEGLSKAKLDKPGLIILDVMMESDDKGFDIARELKADPDYCGIPILMLTAIKERTGFDLKMRQETRFGCRWTNISTSRLSRMNCSQRLQLF